MKKLTSILLILALVLSLAACSQTKQPDVNGDSSVSTSGDNTSPIPIAFIGSMTGLDEIYGYVITARQRWPLSRSTRLVVSQVVRLN